MVDLSAHTAALTAANAALQDQVANLQSGITAPISTIYSRTPDLRDKTNLLNYENNKDRNIYENGISSLLSRDKCFDAMAE